MSYSKKRPQGRSLYLENWNPDARKYIVSCAGCGERGYCRTVEKSDFLATRKGRVIRDELSRLISVLELSDSGLCQDCSDRTESN